VSNRAIDQQYSAYGAQDQRQGYEYMNEGMPPETMTVSADRWQSEAMFAEEEARK